MSPAALCGADPDTGRTGVRWTDDQSIHYLQRTPGRKCHPGPRPGVTPAADGWPAAVGRGDGYFRFPEADPDSDPAADADSDR
jgi:hypothetical protein